MSYLKTDLLGALEAEQTDLREQVRLESCHLSVVKPIPASAELSMQLGKCLSSVVSHLGSMGCTF